MKTQEKIDQAAQIATALSSAGNQARYRDINETLEAVSRLHRTEKQNLGSATMMPGMKQLAGAHLPWCRDSRKVNATTSGCHTSRFAPWSVKRRRVIPATFSFDSIVRDGVWVRSHSIGVRK